MLFDTPRGGQLVWLFDLDNTLHNASHAIFPAIGGNMNRFIATLVGDGNGGPAAPEVSNALRLDYLRRYGATLLGMVRHHQVRPEHFLDEAHRFDDLISMIRAERGLGQLLRRLPGRKILLTNAPHHYAREVLRHLGVGHHFARHIAIESMWVHGQLRPKPSRAMLRKLLAREKLAPHRCVLVEDTVGHLKAAKTLGLRTAWVTQYMASNPNLRMRRGVLARRPVYVDVKVQSVRQLPNRLQRLR